MLLSLLPARSLLLSNAQFPIFSSSSNSSQNCWFQRKSTLRLLPMSCTIQQGPTSSALSSHGQGGKKDEKEDEFRVVTAVHTSYNEIVIVETREHRALLLDSTQNVHSIIKKGPDKWTGSYWDEFAALPAIIPREGPIAILGLGGGTAAHLMLDSWPGLDLEGWEIDEVLIDKARDYLGLSALERPQGSLEVRIGDALSPFPDSGRYAGIVVDLFEGGMVLPPLEKEGTWAELKGRLMPGGRIMVNCGGIDQMSRSWASPWELNPTIKAMTAVFGGGGGELSWKKTAGDNYMTLTGPLPDLEEWAGLVPTRLRENVMQWSLVGA